MEQLINIDVSREDHCLYVTTLKAFFSCTILFASYDSLAQDLPEAEPRLWVQNFDLPHFSKNDFRARGKETVHEILSFFDVPFSY